MASSVIQQFQYYDDGKVLTFGGSNKRFSTFGRLGWEKDRLVLSIPCDKSFRRTPTVATGTNFTVSTPTEYRVVKTTNVVVVNYSNNILTIIFDIQLISGQSEWSDNHDVPCVVESVNSSLKITC